MCEAGGALRLFLWLWFLMGLRGWRSPCPWTAPAFPSSNMDLLTCTLTDHSWGSSRGGAGMPKQLWGFAGRGLLFQACYHTPSLK